jgi:hypothetical protein
MPCFEASWSSSVTVVETFISGRGIGCDAADPQQSGQRQEQHLRQLALTVMLQYPARSPLSGCSRKPCRAERRERVRRSWITPALVWARSPTIADWRPEGWRKTTRRHHQPAGSPFIHGEDWTFLAIVRGPTEKYDVGSSSSFKHHVSGSVEFPLLLSQDVFTKWVYEEVERQTAYIDNYTDQSHFRGKCDRAHRNLVLIISPTCSKSTIKINPTTFGKACHLNRICYGAAIDRISRKRSVLRLRMKQTKQCFSSPNF